MRRRLQMQLAAEYSAESEALAREVLCEFYDLTFTQLIMNGRQAVADSEVAQIAEWTERLKRHEPLQYISGWAHFCGLQMEVNCNVLIPRPETQEIVDLVVEDLPEEAAVLDIGTGSGCIAVAVSSRKPDAKVSAVDISADALEVARRNAERNGVKVNFQQCDILKEMPEGEFDMVVSNPPYVCDRERAQMERNVLDFEPWQALFVPDDDPLRFYRVIAQRCVSGLLKCGGKLVFEINERYGRETAAMLREMGFDEVQVVKDYCEKDRFVVGRN